MEYDLENSDGDECPVTTKVDGETEECNKTLTLREYPRNPQFEDTDPAHPEAELICPIHGIVESGYEKDEEEDE